MRQKKYWIFCKLFLTEGCLQFEVFGSGLPVFLSYSFGSST